MRTGVDKLIKARDLIKEVEDELINRIKFCPYEVGYTLRNLDDAIEQVRKMEKEQ